ncbi:MAG: zinc transporter ZupT [Candidatus Competibacteraceae bacterium]|nr:zinc transporter ZupT [Candidatus Competibacteraceae bacterium]
MEYSLLFALILTTLAGLATGLGGLLVLFSQRADHRTLARALGFSAGVMLYVSVLELLPEAHKRLSEMMAAGAWLILLLAFLGGVLLIWSIDRLVPEPINPHSTLGLGDEGRTINAEERRLARLGLLAALAIAVHNFPEGVATLFSALSEPGVGLSVALAIGLHNLPEGVAVALPLYHAYGSRRRAVGLSFAAGLAEPLGAIVAYGLLWSFLTDGLMGVMLALVAGIMVYISLEQLVPHARRYGRDRDTLYSLLAGVAAMILLLPLF